MYGIQLVNFMPKDDIFWYNGKTGGFTKDINFATLFQSEEIAELVSLGLKMKFKQVTTVVYVKD